MQKIAESNKSDVYSSADYIKSRRAYMIQCAVEYFISILAADAFLAKLLGYIGVSDSVTGIVSSFISLAFMFQLLVIPLMKKMKNVKKTVLIFDTLSQALFMSIYLVPFLPISSGIKTALVVIAVLCAYFSMYLINSIYYKWANSYVAPSERGEYSAVKEMVSLFGGVVFTLVVGFIIDKFESLDSIEGGFLFIASVILVLNICNFLCLLRIKNSNVEEESGHSLKEICQNTLGKKSFRYVVTMTSVWDIGRYMTLGFMGTFKTNDLLLSVGIVQVINMVANLMRLLVSKPFGRYSDKKSFAKGFNLALVIAAVGYLFNMFSAPDRVWCVVVFTVMYAVCQAGTNQNSFNIVYSYVDSDYIVPAMSIKNCVGGILGFCSSLVGAKILAYVQGCGNNFLGINIYGQQLLSALSLVFVIAAMFINKFGVQKQKRYIQ